MPVATCTKCKEEKPVSEFPIMRSRKSGIHSICLACKREHWRKTAPLRNGAGTRRTELETRLEQLRERLRVKRLAYMKQSVRLRHAGYQIDGVERAIKKLRGQLERLEAAVAEVRSGTP